MIELALAAFLYNMTLSPLQPEQVKENEAIWICNDEICGIVFKCFDQLCYSSISDDFLIQALNKKAL